MLFRSCGDASIHETFAGANGEWVSRNRFIQESGLKDSNLFRHFAACPRP
jgi:hypothetical protein